MQGIQHIHIILDLRKFGLRLDTAFTYHVQECLVQMLDSG